jgi:DNA-binding GntR family transcriptional regulator
MTVPDYAVQRPAYLQIADDLRGKIKTKQYAPGQRLPSNRDLSGHYGVAYETMRQALEVLREEKLIATQSTRGTFVLKEPPEPEPDPDILRLETAMRDVLQRLGKLEGRISALEGVQGGQQ